MTANTSTYICRFSTYVIIYNNNYKSVRMLRNGNKEERDQGAPTN